MNEVEKAIAELESHAGRALKTALCVETAGLAVEALQEKTKRDKMRCGNCKSIRFNDNFHWCGCSAGLDGNRKVTDFCSYFEPKENENE